MKNFNMTCNNITDPQCPKDEMDPKNVCDCSRTTKWVKGSWKDPWCDKGKCYSGINSPKCHGKPNDHQLDDGTWCWNGYRYTECPVIGGNKF